MCMIAYSRGTSPSVLCTVKFLISDSSSIANHDETQIKDTAIRFKIKYQHPDDSGTGTNTILRLTAPWQYVEPSTESCLQEPNATLRIYVHPGRQEL